MILACLEGRRGIKNAPRVVFAKPCLNTWTNAGRRGRHRTGSVTSGFIARK